MTVGMIVSDNSTAPGTRRRPLKATQVTKKYQIEAIHWGGGKQLKCFVFTILVQKWEGHISIMSISYNNIISVTHRIQKRVLQTSEK